MIDAITLSLMFVNFPLWDGDVPLMVYTFRNLLGLLESAFMLRTSMREIIV